MAWTYDASQMLSVTAGTYPGSTVGLRNQMRFVLQDVNTNRQLLQDAELDWAQTTEANQYLAAALCCDILVARVGNISSKRVGALALTYDATFYQSLAATLRARGLTHQVPYCGGISISDKLAQQDDADWVPVRFFRGQFDNPRASQPTAGEEPNRSGVNSPGAY